MTTKPADEIEPGDRFIHDGDHWEALDTNPQKDDTAVGDSISGDDDGEIILDEDNTFEIACRDLRSNPQHIYRLTLDADADVELIP